MSKKTDIITKKKIEVCLSGTTVELSSRERRETAALRPSCIIYSDGWWWWWCWRWRAREYYHRRNDPEKSTIQYNAVIINKGRRKGQILTTE